MREFGIFFLSLTLGVCCSCSKTTVDHQAKKEKLGTALPAPTTDIAEGQEESEDNQIRIKRWLEEINRSIAGKNWRELERTSARQLAASRPATISLGGTESFAGGEVVGTWNERGSANQAGSVHKVRYVPETDTIYAFGGELVNTIGGRSLWKGSRDGSQWTLLNDDYFLEPSILEAFIPTGSSDVRLLSAANKYPMYSDDEGATWNNATTDLTGTEGSQHQMHRVPWDNDTILYLCKSFNSSTNDQRVMVYKSTDAGLSYTRILVTATPSKTKASLWVPTSGNKAYVLVGGHTVHVIDDTSVTDVSTTVLPHQSQVTLSGAIVDGVVTMYALIEDEDVYLSTDEGATWTFVSTIPINAWDVGLRCSPSDPNRLFVAGVETYFSHDGGANWERANRWQDYYSNIDMLHADVMDMQHAETAQGDEFLLIANHGGLHITYDDMVTTTNISKSGLNVGQYYDVLTNEPLPQYLYVGTQDQGMQWSETATMEGIRDFEQVISGDYDSLTLTRGGLSFWNQYPGGQFRYYHDATDIDEGQDEFHNVNGNHIPYWYIPTSSFKSDPNGNAILVGGGEISGGNGSYLIKLSCNTIPPFQITPTQYGFDFRAAAGGSTTISAIEQPAHDPDLFYVTTGNGRFFKSNDAGLSWTMTQGHTGPGDSWIYNAYILSSKINTNTVWTSGAGFGTPAVYQSTDGGETFAPMSNGLPDCRVQHLATNEDESLIFAATSVGPFVYVVSDGQWHPLIGATTPINWYTAVEYLEASKTVRFATFGRGIWDFELETTITALPNNVNAHRGILLAGGLAEARESDDNYLKYNPGFVLNSSEAPVWLVFDGQLNSNSIQELEVLIECNANTPGITQTVEAFDWTVGDYVVVGDSSTSFGSDAVQSIDLSDGIAEWVSAGDGDVRTRVGWRKTGFTIVFPWTLCLDQVAWVAD